MNFLTYHLLYNILFFFMNVDFCGSHPHLHWLDLNAELLQKWLLNQTVYALEMNMNVKWCPGRTQCPDDSIYFSIVVFVHGHINIRVVLIWL